MRHASSIPFNVSAPALLACLAATACHESTTPTVDPTVTLGTSAAWAGSALVLKATGLSGADTLAVVVIGNDTVAVRYAAPDSLIAAAPDTQGTFTVRVGLRGRDLRSVGTIELSGGFSGVWTVSPVGGHPVAWPGGTQGRFAIALDSGLAELDPTLQSTVRVLPDSLFSINCINGTGPAAGGRLTVEGSRPYPVFCGPLLAVRPDSPGVAPDTGPSGTGARFATQLAPGRWLVAAHHSVNSYFRDGSGAWVTATTPYHVEEPYEVAVSPGGDRAVVLGRDQAGIGMPVFGLTSPEPVYLLAQYHILAGAQFSANGDTLFVVAYRALTDTAPVIAALAASDGSELRSAPAWGGAYHLVLDPSQPWIYLVGHESPWDAPKVHVYDRATFAWVATLAGRAPDYMNGDANPVLSAATRKLYLVESCSFCSAGSVPVFTFDLTP